MPTFDPTGLRDYQIPHAIALAQAINKPGFPCAWDTSDTGTGKTYAACGLVRHFNVPATVVCPKALMPGWQRVAKQMGLRDGLLRTINYEMVRTGRAVEFGEWATLPRGTTRMRYFKWRKETGILLFDEAQRCRGHDTLNHQIMVGAKLSGVPVIGLSATPAESPMDMRALGYLSGWFDYYHFYNWVQNHNCVKPFGAHKWMFVDRTGRTTTQVMDGLREKLLERGSRISIADLGDAFPKNTIDCQLYRISEAGKINRLYDRVAKEIDLLERRKANDRDPEHGLTKTLRERQEIELLKVGLLEELTRDEILQGRSVVIFCNFLLTIQALASIFHSLDPAIITGADGWTYEIKRRHETTDQANQRFQRNETFLAIAQSDVGGVGLGFHDLCGRPRTSLVNPHWSAMVFAQNLGRIHRDGALSPALQKFPLIEGTIEERVYEALVQKRGNLQKLLTDADLQPYCGLTPKLVHV
jgi:superfamily II DNA or RNA helicase